MDDLKNNLLSEPELQADEYVKRQFIEASKWSRFISIVMFVFAVLILLVGLAGSALFSSIFENLGGQYAGIFRMGGAVLIVITLLVAAVIAVLYYFLFAFSSKIKNAVLSESPEELTDGLKMLKLYFIISTVFAIIVLLNNIYSLFK
jgi:heme/copper-type cytochrome/quinol oxidase subunit 2